MSEWLAIDEHNRDELLAFYAQRIARARTERSKDKWRFRIEFMDRVIAKQNARQEN